MSEQIEIPESNESGISKSSPMSSLMKALLSALMLLLRVARIAILVGIVIGALLAAAYILKKDDEVRTKFEGKKWSLPARVFARPLELYEGKSLSVKDLEKELHLLRYRASDDPATTGTYNRQGNIFYIHSRGFKFAEDLEEERLIRVGLKKGRVVSLTNAGNKSPLSLMRLEPILIGNFYPYNNEDRVLVRLNEVPPLLTEGLIAVEDKNYYNHMGVNPTSILRAVIANVKKGKKVQGGSTLTQQLVKNYFLTNEQSYKRKANEATMSMLLELHYSKDEILQAYMNEIYLGQNGQRAIHGFGKASLFYFGLPTRELSIEQIALLIGMAKGASFYNPRRFPNRAKKRRNLVLDIMAREGVLSADQVVQSKEAALGIIKKRPASVNPFPTYLELVRKQLRRDYQEEDLKNEGMLIFTAMDPIVQLQAEEVLQKRVRKLERGNRIPKGKLNAAMVISNVGDGEVLAIVGGTNPRYAGYNRALDARRQIGSVVKPAVYLAALERSRKYNLATRVSDAPVVVRVGKEYWKPRNYDQKDIGSVLFIDALVQSRNTPTVRIGIKTGLDNVIDMMHEMGIRSVIPQYPSILLGTSELAPIEVQQMYQTLATGGMYTPLKAIRSVMDSYGKTLKRYPLNVKQVASPASVYQVTYAMNQITKRGTAKYLSGALPGWKNSAGKTGTTNNKRDSWYAGFTGQHVITVWVGRDDNKETTLTGASGALRLWADMIRVLPTKPFKPKKPKDLRWIKVDKESGLLHNRGCGSAVSLPFAKNAIPKRRRKCSAPPPVRQAPAKQPKPEATQQAPSKPLPSLAPDSPIWQGLGQ